MICSRLLDGEVSYYSLLAKLLLWMCLEYLCCGVAGEQGLENEDGILLQWRDASWFGDVHDRSNGR